MRILAIRIHNLASLVGTQPEIRFGADGLAGGLVAITGPTGSGKSTILDALCLALYGSTPRLQQADKQDKDGRQVECLLSRGSDDAFAEVDFSDSQDRLLRARWSVARARTGRLQPPQMNLTELGSGDVIATGKRAVEAAVQVALGMDCQQFIGVVLLSQGSFSSFLRGDKGTRSALLERLTGTAIYGELSQAAHRDEALKQQAVNELAARLEGCPLLTDEERTALVGEREEAQATTARQEAHWQARRSQVQALAAATTALRVREEQAARLAASQDACASAAGDRLRLEQAQAAEALRLPMHQVDRARKEHQRAADALATARQDLKTATHKAEEARSALLPIMAELLGARDRLMADHAAAARDAADPGERAALAHDLVRWRALATTLTRREEGLRSVGEKIAGHDQAGASLGPAAEAAAQSLTDRLAALNTTQAALDEASTRGSAEALLSRRMVLDRLEELRQQLVAATAQLTGLAAGCAQAERAEAAARQAVAERSSQAESLRLVSRNADEMLELARSEAALAEHRHVLRPGEPCPLCEQTVTALPAHDPGTRLPQMSRKCDELRAQSTAAQEVVETARLAHQKAQSDRQHGERTLASAQERQARDLQAYAARASGVDQPGDPLAADAAAGLAAQRAELETRLGRLQSLALERDQARLAHQQAQQTHQVAHDQLHRHASESRLLAQEQSDLRNRLAEDRAEHQALSTALTTASTRMAAACACPAPGLEDLEDWLAARAAAHAHWRSLEDLRAELEAPCSELLEAVRAALPAGHVLEPAARSADAARSCLSVAKRQWQVDQNTQQGQAQGAQAVLAAERAVGERGVEVEQAGQALAQAIEASCCQDHQTARAWLLEPSALGVLAQRIQTLDREADIARSEHTAAEDRLRHCMAELGPEAPALADLAMVQAAAEQAEHAALEQRDAARAAYQRLDLQLRQDENHRQQAGSLREELARRTSEHALAARLQALIGHHDGERFRAYAQTLTLDQLVGFANHRLTSFAPRYRLATREDLQLDVIDGDLADERRPVNSLSGGESFLVSLALALALADFKRGTSSIGSVFIDEGFGSLDAGSLDLAIATLEQVQNDLGAQVVVISHVGQLQDRWSDHIQVRRCGRGRSWLVLPGGPPGPPRPAGASLLLPLDVDAIERVLAEGGKMTRSKIAKALDIPNDGQLKKALEADERFILDGRTWAMAATSPGGVE